MLNYTCDLGNNDNCTSLPKTIVIVNCVINAPLMLISIIGNALVLAAILRTPSLRSPSTIFLCNLAASDILVGIVVQPVYIVSELKPESSLLQHAYNMLSLLGCGVSLGTMAAISVDRYLALHYHMRYPNLMTKKRALCTSGALWSMCLLLTCLSFISRNIYLLTNVVGIAMCISVTTFSYISIYRIVRQHQLQIHVQQQAVQCLNAEHHLNMVQSKKSAINTFIYYISTILCYSPVFISMFILVIFPERPRKAWIFADTVLFMNSSINPFLYCWRLHELRTAVIKNATKTLIEGNLTKGKN